MSDNELAVDDMPTIVKKAWETGQAIDLNGIGYGRLHWGNQKDIIDSPSPYYYFLAGVVRRHNMTRILEIGTHWAGATRSMYQGVSDLRKSKIVTVDITTESDSRLAAYPDIKKFVGDGNSEEVFSKVVNEFGFEPVDLIYIDAAHQTMPVFTSFALYTMALKPKLVIFDDVTLNEGMRKAWDLITAAVSEKNAINAADLVRAIRPSPDNPGFGVTRIESNVARGF